MRKTRKYFCVVCNTYTSGVGITADDGTHICMDCAEEIYEVMKEFHAAHLDSCDCGCQQT